MKQQNKTGKIICAIIALLFIIALASLARASAPCAEEVGSPWLPCEGDSNYCKNVYCPSLGQGYDWGRAYEFGGMGECKCACGYTSGCGNCGSDTQIDYCWNGISEKTICEESYDSSGYSCLWTYDISCVASVFKCTSAECNPANGIADCVELYEPESECKKWSCNAATGMCDRIEGGMDCNVCTAPLPQEKPNFCNSDADTKARGLACYNGKCVAGTGAISGTCVSNPPPAGQPFGVCSGENPLQQCKKYACGIFEGRGFCDYINMELYERHSKCNALATDDPDGENDCRVMACNANGNCIAYSRSAKKLNGDLAFPPNLFVPNGVLKVIPAYQASCTAFQNSISGQFWQGVQTMGVTDASDICCGYPVCPNQQIVRGGIRTTYSCRGSCDNYQWWHMISSAESCNNLGGGSAGKYCCFMREIQNQDGSWTPITIGGGGWPIPPPPAPLTYYNTCAGGRCVVLPGTAPTGNAPCSSDSECINPATPKHFICQGENCFLADGAGNNECLDSSQCTSLLPTEAYPDGAHRECNALCQCVIAPLATRSSCFDNEDCCLQPLGYHLECQAAQCVIASGNEPNSCLNENDCTVNLKWKNMMNMDITQSDLGDTVKLIVENYQGTPGASIAFEIYEKDAISDDAIRAGANAVIGIVDSNGNAAANWAITSDDLAKTSDYDNFVFRVAGHESPELLISPAIDNSPPTAVITSPLDGSAFKTGVVVSFIASIADEDDDLSVLWEFGDQGTRIFSNCLTTSTCNAQHSYVSSGNKNVKLKATEQNRIPAQYAEDSSTILTYASGINIFAVISSPQDEDFFVQNPGDVVSFNAAGSFVEYCDLTCPAGKTCHAVGGLQCYYLHAPNTAPGALTGYNLQFNWSFSEGTARSGNWISNYNDVVEFSNIFNSQGRQWAKLKVGYEIVA